MKKAISTFLGFIAAATIPAMYLAVMFPLGGVRDLTSVLLSLFVLFSFSSMAAIVVGIPAYLVFKRLNLFTWWSSTGSGALAGLLVSFAITSNFDPSSRLRFTLLGGAAGLVFWVVSKLGQP